MRIEDLEIYNLAVEISGIAWKIYEKFDWHDQKIIGDQFITAIDSVGANIAEGFGRYHYLDKNKFNYNARASLLEAVYWINLLEKRAKISKEQELAILEKINILHPKLNSYISATKNQKAKEI